MRNDFVKQVKKEMEKNEDIFFLTADLGFNALEQIRDTFPDRFINVGIAEANMIGVASGLALTGKTVIAYSIASFLSMRAFEQIRVDACYHNLNVKLFGAGGGFNYAPHGVTHHTIEDLAIMRALPNMKIFNPAYSWEATEVTHATLTCDGPTYTRLGKAPATDFSKTGWKFEIGRAYEVKNGKNIVILSTGNILDVAMRTAKILEKSLRKTVSVLSIPSVKPLDNKLILEKAKSAEALFTMEEHSIHGGLGGAVAELLSQANATPETFKIFGFPDRFVKDVGNRDYLLNKVNLSSDTLAETIKKLI